jgi:anti-sigma regulatory factor (Ser/Thr protein kinase)
MTPARSVTSSIPVHERTGISEARRVASAITDRLRFREDQAGRVALIVTEAATNILKHAGGGEMLISAVQRGGTDGVEVIALDIGPGIQDLTSSMRDGFSTSGSPGTGLGAIARLASDFDVYSAPGKGTVLLARIFPERGPVPYGRAGSDLPLEFGGVAVPKRGERECGDAWHVRPNPKGAGVIVSDGLGHGPAAAAASARAVEIFLEHPDASLPELMALIHGALRPTRGAAVSLLRLSLEESQIRYVGVGNIAASVVSGAATRQMVGFPGTAGHEAHRIQELTYPYPQGALVLLHSDGITAHWSADRYPGLVDHDPSIIAAILYRDFNRGRDDATAVVLRQIRAV